MVLVTLREMEGKDILKYPNGLGSIFRSYFSTSLDHVKKYIA
jgi:hypothetical protein